MSQAIFETAERVVDVREISPSIRHTVIVSSSSSILMIPALCNSLSPTTRAACSFSSKINTANAFGGRISNMGPIFGVSDSGLALRKLSRDLEKLHMEHVMSHQENNLLAMGVFDQIMAADNDERAYLESLVRSDYERCHPDERFEDLKRRARFTKEDRGLLYEWMALAARRGAERSAKSTVDLYIAA